MNVPALAARVLFAASLALAFGCAKRAHETQLAQAPVVLPQDDILTPVVRGGANGLEVLWFVCRDEQQALATALAPFVYQPVDLAPEAADALQRNGLRVVRVPLADFSTVRAALRPVGPTERSWLGWSLDWAEAFRARSLHSGATVLVNGDPLTLHIAGTRFIARAWGSPTIDGERVRVEFATQLLAETPAIAPFDPLRAAEPVDLSAYELRRGQVLDDLAFEAQLEPGFAYLVVPAAPEEDWASLAAGAAPVDEEELEAPAPGFEFADAPRDPADLGIVFGPPAPAPLTIGQAILTSWDPFESRADAAEQKPVLKAVVALVPRCDTPARLLPPAANLAQR